MRNKMSLFEQYLEMAVKTDDEKIKKANTKAQNKIHRAIMGGVSFNMVWDKKSKEEQIEYIVNKILAKNKNFDKELVRKIVKENWKATL